MEVADMQDECIKKMRELSNENMERKNKLLGSLYEKYQTNRRDRVFNELCTSKIGPAYL